MTEQTMSTSGLALDEIFSGAVEKENRPGYTGFVLPVERLLEVAGMIKSKYRYDFLSSITSTDYYPEDRIDIVYHFRQLTGGEPLTLHVPVSRTDSRVPSLVHLFPGAEFQEREIYDMMGVTFENHPDLRRLLTWEGFHGHPLLKDWKEPFFEEDVKPFKSRWPDGHANRIEDRNPYRDNVQYPLGFNPDTWEADNDRALYDSLQKTPDYNEDSVRTEQIVINLGPQHPSTHGVFRMVATLDGEKIVDLKPAFGYLHRNHEKIGERNTFLQNMPYTDRLDYICSMTNNFGYAVAVEKLMGIAIPERAEYIRVIMSELTRVSNHLIAIGFLLNDLGAFFTPVLYAFVERELILDIFEAVSGSRMMCNYFRFGGVVRDIQPDQMKKIKELVDRLPHKVDELEQLLTDNEIVRVRTEGVGILTPEQAVANSATGPLLRASGIPFDLRRADPYSIYDRFDFDVCVRYHGDIYDRYLLRLDEIRQSIRILEQAVRDIPEGPVLTGKPSYLTRVPAGEAYGRIESPKGELGFYVVSNGKPNPVRYHVRPPTLINLTSLRGMCIGQKVADVVCILGSIDIVLGEVDR